MNNAPGILKVYKASAGSGKTFTLVSEYIALLVNDPQNSHKQILAVTFTNKATQEMKVRILSQLYGIANALPESDGYLSAVKAATGLNDATIRNNARIALHKLTHEYSQFRVQTIDAFFQSVLRNLGRELGLTAGLRVDLNSDQVEAKAVDELIEDLKDGDEVLAWLDDYIQSNIDESKGWNVIDQIKKFGQNIFKEYYKENEEALNHLFMQPSFFKEFEKTLREKRDDYKKKVKEQTQSIITDIDKSGFPADFHRYVRGFLVKMYNKIDELPEPSNYVNSLSEDTDIWAKKSSKNASTVIAYAAEHHLAERFKAAVAHWEGNWKEYYSCQLILKHLSKLRLLHKIAEKVSDDNAENHRFMLSDTQALLKQLMRDEDIPFVYEKIGGMLKYIMIDEFQDTSSVQWDNFKKLLLNCIAEVGSKNLIVGDVKQSIYRWRQGDWEILNNIREAIKPDNNTTLDDAQIEVTSLETNYRSEENIIWFNNSFFKEIVAQIGKEVASADASNGKKKAEITGEQFESLARAYKDVEQKVPESKQTAQGYVKIKLFGKGSGYDEDIEKELKENVTTLLAEGFQPKDIAVLVRNRGEIQSIVGVLNQIEYEGKPLSIISEEAFRLDSSLAINLLIYALRLLTHPEDNLTRALLVKAYLQVPLDSADLMWQKRQGMTMSKVFVADSAADKLHRKQNVTELLNEWLPVDFVQKQAEMRRMAMVDLVDFLYLKFGLKNLSQQNSYISTFYDVLNNYLKDAPADIDDFLTEWEESLSATTIQSDEANGIRILTIHKSKGLEFENVIIPYCDWQLEKFSGREEVIKWFEGKDKEEPFCRLPLIPVNYSDKLLNSVFAQNFRKEHFQNIVDNLNLLYVAFTRAGRNLFISGRYVDEKDRVCNLLRNSLLSMASEKVLFCEYKDDEYSGKSKEEWEKYGITEESYQPVCFAYGSLKQPKKHQKQSTEVADVPAKAHLQPVNPFISKPENKLITIETFGKQVEFKQSNKSDEFVRGEDIDDRARYMKIGTILHNIFSSIRTAVDIPAKLQLLEEEGITYSDEITPDALRGKIEKALSLPMVKDWFSDRWEVFNECSILQYDAVADEIRDYRPDRVIKNDTETIVIDYKFGKENKYYPEQVRGYMRLLEQMGYKNVKGYLWYVMADKVVSVNP